MKLYTIPPDLSSSATNESNFNPIQQRMFVQMDLLLA